MKLDTATLSKASFLSLRSTQQYREALKHFHFNAVDTELQLQWSVIQPTPPCCLFLYDLVIIYCSVLWSICWQFLPSSIVREFIHSRCMPDPIYTSMHSPDLCTFSLFLLLLSVAIPGVTSQCVLCLKNQYLKMCAKVTPWASRYKDVHSIFVFDWALPVFVQSEAFSAWLWYGAKRERWGKWGEEGGELLGTFIIGNPRHGLLRGHVTDRH